MAATLRLSAWDSKSAVEATGCVLIVTGVSSSIKVTVAGAPAPTGPLGLLSAMVKTRFAWMAALLSLVMVIVLSAESPAAQVAVPFAAK